MRKQRLDSLKRSRLTKIRFIFVPGHMGVKGNELSDRACWYDHCGRAMRRADILIALKEAGCIKDPGDDCGSKTMDRLLEKIVVQDVARQERWARSQRRPTNQTELVPSVVARLGGWGGC